MTRSKAGFAVVVALIDFALENQISKKYQLALRSNSSDTESNPGSKQLDEWRQFLEPSLRESTVYSALSSKQPKIATHQSIGFDGITTTITYPTDTSTMTPFYMAHEATHANEYHTIKKDGLFSVLLGTKAFASSALISRLITKPTPASILAGFCLMGLAVCDMQLQHDALDKRVVKGPIFKHGLNPRSSFFSEAAVMRLSKNFEHKADQGAIKLIKQHHPDDAEAILRAAKTHFDKERRDDKNIGNLFSPSHPRNADRAQQVAEALESIKPGSLRR